MNTYEVLLADGTTIQRNGRSRPEVARKLNKEEIAFQMIYFKNQ
jgi:hypothetical protein